MKETKYRKKERAKEKTEKKKKGTQIERKN